MRTTFLPLRTNAAWFANEKSLDGLHLRLKAVMMLYDKVVLQDGRYQCTVQKTGTMDAFVSSAALGKNDRRRISFALGNVKEYWQAFKEQSTWINRLSRKET
jgi:K+/H+ antiporter YhaU regulatory subunit KhtT